MSTPGWKPLLAGSDADRAQTSARQVARDLAVEPAGSAGDRAVFWAHAAAAIDEPFAHAAYEAAIDDLIAATRAGASHVALYGGLAGLGWALGHVIDDADLAPIDELVVGLLATSPWPGPLDLVHGVAGLGLYLLGRDGERAREGRARVVAQLARVARPWCDGDLGVAHGAPGIIGVLARMAEGDDEAARAAKPIVGEATAWLDGLPRSSGFPTRAGGGTTRTAWCYGDPGIAAALWTCAPGLANEIAIAAAARHADDDTGVRDACLCHGSAGLAHLFNRLYQASGEPAFEDAARRWFARTLTGHFLTWRGDSFDRDVSLLEGEMGIALALLAACRPIEPTWDRLLLCDLPPRGASA